MLERTRCARIGCLHGERVWWLCLATTTVPAHAGSFKLYLVDSERFFVGIPQTPTPISLQAELPELTAIEAESIGWLPLGENSYLHVGDLGALVIDVVGVPEAGMAGMNVLWGI